MKPCSAELRRLTVLPELDLRAPGAKPSPFFFPLIAASFQNSADLLRLLCAANFQSFQPSCCNPSPLHSNQLFPILLFSPTGYPPLFRGMELPSLLSDPTHSHFLTPSPPQILLSLCLSLRLKTFQFSCHKLCSPAQLSKQGGVPFIPPHILRKEMGGRRALTLVFGHKQLSLIIVFLFSFPVAMEV